MAHHSFRYRNFTILKDQTLGHGSYGAVYKAKCDQLTCAAKVLHPTIVDSYDPGSERILQRFQQECDFLNQIRHPHIVQYLGVCRDPDSNLPALLIELLDGSLTKMLEQSPHPISYHIQVDLCHHIALAIAYLHSNGIIHRDLSGNNVLVIAGRLAKVTDFGMSRIVGTQYHLTPLTLCPGTLAYMSPESLKEPPRYTEKLDVFSQGVIMIQVCTRQFPDPGPPVKEIEDSRYPMGMVQVVVPERERRKNHIDLIDPTHPLLPIALACLEYRERDRPSAEKLCQRLAELKENQEYIESSQSMAPATPEVDGILQQEQDELVRQVEEKDCQLAAKDQQIEIKDQQIDTKVLENQRLEMQIQELNRRLVDNEQVVAHFRETNQQLQRNIQDLQKMVPELPKDIVLQCRDGGKAPFCDLRRSSVVDVNVAYFSSGNEIYSYDSFSRIWNNLPECPQRSGSLAVVKGLLTMVGGEQTSANYKKATITNKLVSLIEDRKWVEQYPPMPTGRSNSTANTYQNYLIVAGGTSTGLTIDNMDTVEVLNTDTLVWSTAASLPHPFGRGSATIASGRLYMLGGSNRNGSCQSVFSCSLVELFLNQSTSYQRHLVGSIKLWQCETDIPVYWSTCATVHGQLVSVGGSDVHGRETTAIYTYDPNTRSWTCIGDITVSRRLCYIVAFNVNHQRLMVVGGRSVGGKYSECVEFAEY